MSPTDPKLARRNTQSDRATKEAHVITAPQAPTAVIQRAIATRPATLTDAVRHDHALYPHLVRIANWITQYNHTQANPRPDQAPRLQQQLNLLRQIDHEIYQCMNIIGQGTLELNRDAIAQLLHQLATETDAQHEDIIDTITRNRQLRRDVNPLLDTEITPRSAATFTGHAGYIRQLDALPPEKASAQWRSMRSILTGTGPGKIKMVGDASYNRKMKSWLTKLMYTGSGRQLLKTLNSGNPDDVGTHIYLGQNRHQLPDAALKVVDSDFDVQSISMATPLRKKDASLDVDAGPAEDAGGKKLFRETTNPAGFREAVMEAVMDRRRCAGVEVNEQRYRFGAGTGVFVHISTEGAGVPVCAGTERMGAAELEMQVYFPKWVTLGHELGHAANLRAGAGTPTSDRVDPVHTVFAKQWSGKTGKELNDLWYDGSEEFLTITNIENPIRDDVGLDTRGAHSSPAGIMRLRRQSQIDSDLNYHANMDKLEEELKRDGVNDATALQIKELQRKLAAIRTQLARYPNDTAFRTLREMAQGVNKVITADNTVGYKRALSQIQSWQRTLPAKPSGFTT
jgi:hypothetical protein